MEQADRTDPSEPQGSAPPPPYTPPPGPPPGPPRRLYREPEEKKLTGVCGGIADYVGIDPTLVRLGVALLTFATGAVAIAYIIAAFVVPERPATVARVTRRHEQGPDGWSTGTQVLAVLIVVAMLGWADLDWWFNAPTVAVALVVLGVWLLTSDRSPTAGHRRVTDGDDGQKDPPSANAWSAAGTTVTGDAYGTVEHAPTAPYESVPTDDSVIGAEPRGEAAPPAPPWGVGSVEAPSASPGGAFDDVDSPYVSPPAGSSDRVGRGRRRSDRPRGAGLPLVVLAALLIGAGVLSLFGVTGAADIGPGKAVAGGLLIIGLGMVLGTWRGNGRPLVFIGLPVAAALVLVDLVDVPWDAGFEDVTYRVETTGDLADHYELTGGQMTIDLSDLPLDAEARRSPPTVEADLGFGELAVIVPADADVTIEAGAGMGDITGGPAGNDGGVDLREEWEMDGEEGGGRVHLDLYVGMGEIEVRRAAA